MYITGGREWVATQVKVCPPSLSFHDGEYSQQAQLGCSLASGQSSTASRRQLFDSEDSHNTGIRCHTHFFTGAVCVARALLMEPPPQSPIYICQCVCHRLMSPGCFRQHSYHCDRRAGTVLRRFCSGFQVPVHHGQKGSVKQLPSQPPGRRAKGILTRARMRERP